MEIAKMKQTLNFNICHKLGHAGDKTGHNPVTDNDYFISLIQMAMDHDDGIRDIIKGLVMKDRNERMVLLAMIIRDFEKNRIDPELIEALRYLNNDEITGIIKNLLK